MLSLVLWLRELDFPRYGIGKHRAALELVHVACAQQLDALAPTKRQLAVIGNRDTDGTKRICAFDRHEANMRCDCPFFQPLSVIWKKFGAKSAPGAARW